jgi:hypothetical protein
LRPYKGDRGLINRRAQEVRRTLSELVATAMDDSTASLAPILKKLAGDGAKLRKALFHSDDDPERSAKVERWFSSRTGPRRVTFVVDGYVHVPWGLIYDGDPEALSDDADAMDPSVYNGFWCLKYLACCVYSRVQPLSADDVRPRDSTYVLAVVDQRELANSVGHLPAEEAAVLELHMGQAIVSTEELRVRWEQLQKSNRVLFFYCHANETTLALSTQTSLRPTF